MGKHLLYYGTNRQHVGANRWRPDGYGRKFSDDGVENLRFGRLLVEADDARVTRFVAAERDAGRGDGEGLAGYLAKRAEAADIRAYEEKLDPAVSDVNQRRAKLGSKAMFGDLYDTMRRSTDVLVYIHGFNVPWTEAVGSALALQVMLEHSAVRDSDQHVQLVLFTWPSDGLALPLVSYKSDRTEARGSGFAFGRGMLKVRDFLIQLRDRTAGGAELCGQDIHLLCHSMGNYLLQEALARIDEFTPGPVMPRIFEHVFLCAPDVDDDTLEPGRSMGKLHELARSVDVYHNRGDKAMYVSDYTKGNPERLGTNGAARPSMLHNKIHQVDCSLVVSAGFVEHSYYLSGLVNADLRQSIDGLAPDAPARNRVRDPDATNLWVLTR